MSRVGESLSWGGARRQCCKARQATQLRDLVNLDKEFGHYPKSNGKSLKNFKQGIGMMRPVFLKITWTAVWRMD